MRRLCAALGVIAVSAVAFVPVAGADQPPAEHFRTKMRVGPACDQANFPSKRPPVFGRADFDVEEEPGVVRFGVSTHGLPSLIFTTHVHNAPEGVIGPIVQDLGEGRLDRFFEHGSIDGDFTNAALVAAIRANPQDYYVDVHLLRDTAVCLRGQLDEHGPLNN